MRIFKEFYTLILSMLSAKDPRKQPIVEKPWFYYSTVNENAHHGQLWGLSEKGR